MKVIERGKEAKETTLNKVLEGLGYNPKLSKKAMFRTEKPEKYKNTFRCKKMIKS